MYFAFRLEGLNTVPIHWFKPTRSRNILPNWTFLVLFSSHLVPNVQWVVIMIRGDRNAKDNQCQQETEWLQSLIVGNRWQA